jgi:uncharacterized RDD family membrane protein YckC
MEWYFVDNGERSGPHEEDAFAELIRSGKVGPATLVWRAGMGDWLPLEQARPALPPPIAPSAAEAPAAAPGEVASAAVTAPAQGRCGVCGTERSADDLVQFRDTLVCPVCKPAYVQRMREGTTQPGHLRYAGFWIRVAAKLIDGAILGVVSIVITIVTGAAMAGMIAGGGDKPNVGGILALQGVNMLLQTAVQVAFAAFFLPRYAATPGKMATGLVVVRSDGSTLTVGRAVGRTFAEWLSGVILGIGYLMVAFDEEKRALHDRICDTRVAYKNSRA